MNDRRYGKSKLQTTYRAAKRSWGDKLRVIDSETEANLIEEVSKKIAGGYTLEQIEKEFPQIVNVQVKLQDKTKGEKIGSETILKDKAKDVVIQYFRRNKITDSVESHFVIFATAKSKEKKKQEDQENKSEDSSIKTFRNLFGNVDLAIIPKEASESSGIMSCQKKDMDSLERRHLVSISTYLDHGQTLNIAGLSSKLFEQLKKQRRNPPENPYKQYLDSFCSYYDYAPNGKLMKVSYPEKLLLLHETKNVPLIKQSKKMKVAAAGCLGSVVYSTLISTGSRLGSHTLAINARMNDGKVDPKHFLYLEVQNKDRMLTNWLERLGFGRLWLETAYLLQEDKIEKNSQKANILDKLSWVKDDREYRDYVKMNERLQRNEQDLAGSKFNPVKYAQIFKLHDELLRAREIACGIGDKFYERKGNPSYKNYLETKKKMSIEYINKLEGDLKVQLEKVNSIQLNREISKREKQHFSDRVLHWANRVYKDDPELEQMKKRAFVPPYFKWKNDDEVATDKDIIAEKVEQAVNNLIFYSTQITEPIAPKSLPKEAHTLLRNTFLIAEKTAQINILKKSLSLASDERKIEHIIFIINNLTAEISSIESKTALLPDIPGAMLLYKQVNEILPFVLSVQDQYLDAVLEGNTHDATIMSEEYRKQLLILYNLVKDDPELMRLVSDRLEHNRMRHCFNKVTGNNYLFHSMRTCWRN